VIGRPSDGFHVLVTAAGDRRRCGWCRRHQPDWDQAPVQTQDVIKTLRSVARKDVFSDASGRSRRDALSDLTCAAG
jgi:hypothetical protein